MDCQENRSLQVESHFEEDHLFLTELEGFESLSEGFEFAITLKSAFPIEADELLAKPLSIGIKLPSHAFRRIHGIISNLVMGPMEADGIRSYEATLVPWFTLLKMKVDCRIFQCQSVIEIISTLFDENGYSDYEFQCHDRGKSPRNYCVQYRESVFDFISRILEEEGIWYYFRHEKHRHVLVMADSPVAHPQCPEQYEVYYDGTRRGGLRDEGMVWDAKIRHKMTPQSVFLQDYNFTSPKMELSARVGQKDGHEIFDYPGGYHDNDGGGLRSRVDLERHLTEEKCLEGSGACADFSAGYAFDLHHFHEDGKVETYILKRVEHKVSQPLSITDRALRFLRYENHFECLPNDTTYCPPRRIPKPRIDGTQTAFVVGKAGEEIWTDEFGRVKVHFHWDRHNREDEYSSCWIRVSQNWAGAGWGSMVIPRVGQEVIVDFLNGDPDRPIIVGQVYNGDFSTPYELPADQTKTVLRTQSSKDSVGFNELTFEDKAGSEEIYMHAERNLNQEIRNDHLVDIGHDESITITGDRRMVIKEGHMHTRVKTGDQRTVLEAGDQRTVLEAGSQYTRIERGDRSVVVVEGGVQVQSKGLIDYESERDSIEMRAGQDLLWDAKKEASMYAKRITLDGQNEVEIKVGGNTIKVSQGKVEIETGVVNVNAKGKVVVKGAMIELN